MSMQNTKKEADGKNAIANKTKNGGTGMIKLRMTCYPEQAPQALSVIESVFEVDKVSKPYDIKGAAAETVRIYIDARCKNNG